MRLIDADMLKKYMINNSKEVERFLGYIDEQPTAYNVDEVVERLEKLKKEEQDRSDDCDENGCCDSEEIYDDGRSQGRFETYEKAIKAMEMCREKYLSRMELDGGYDMMHGCYVQPNYWVLQKAFRFPKDEEVEQMRYTTYHCGKAVIKDKNKLSEAMEKLARLEDAEDTNVPGKWIPITERLPEDESYVLVSFQNATMVDIARYEEDDEGGSFYPGDDEDPYSKYGIYVNAWMPLPELYREVTDEDNLESRR